ncbi:MAG: hypothetical protein GJ671_09520 [Alteromonadaceae bacterium]|nr:hypothetical protein [Alteromonadaceae bacterium]
MKLTKQALKQDINRSRSIDAYRFTDDELKSEKDLQLKQFKQDIDKKMRLNKSFTLILIED